ncbi:unnamed protein product [Gulo gulo]|uniref:Uncharacterized protein n=1 Tax=Gulo gulo TaxID=48420 RepID=A0A9X9LJX7_GULGU|nr:unnamed protein product [Gulo gulo]
MLPRAEVDAGTPLPSTGRSPGCSSPHRQSEGSSPPRRSGDQESPHWWQVLGKDCWACGFLCLIFLLSAVLFVVFEGMGQAESKGTNSRQRL